MLDNAINDTANQSFSNSHIATHTLPTIEHLNTHPLSPNYAKTNLALNILGTLFIWLIILTIKTQTLFPLPEQMSTLLWYISFGIISLGSIITIYYWLADPLKSYSLREHDISYCSGLFFKKTVTQPILRIQHIELKRGPIENKVGLATLQVFSAGGALETFEIPGLPVKDAQKLREFILQNTGILQHG